MSRIGISFRRNSVQFTSLFTNNYVDSRSFYMYRFRKVPCISFINGIDVTKAFEYIKAYMATDVVAVYQYSSYSYEAGEVQFISSIIVLTNGRMIELSNTYAEIFHGENQYGFAHDLLRELAAFRIDVEVHTVDTFTPVQVAGFMREQDLN